MNVEFVGAGVVRLFAFGVLWILLAGDLSHPEIAIPTVAAAVGASLYLWPYRVGPTRWRGVPSLAAWFLWQSLRGGVDVARRVLSPSLPVSPAVIEYASRIERRNGRVLFIWMIGLMPGTAGVGWHEDGRVAVHVIDRHRYDADSLRQLESKLRAVFPPGPRP